MFCRDYNFAHRWDYGIEGEFVRFLTSESSRRSFWVNIRVFNAKRIWTSGKEPIAWGLVENIQLPATGEEAMERILKCRGRDAYVILGLRADCTDDDIKRYFKRQAVLVHPDKNPLIGADESFKILSKAFEAIGTPDARAKYNMQRSPLHKEMEELWERLREKMNEARNTMYCDCGMKHSRVPVESIRLSEARYCKKCELRHPAKHHKEMEELWERLREKMNEARNTMYCDCGMKHSRVPVESIRLSEARYCKKCELRHPAKHNDIWAETRFFGLFWVYYTCQYGTVYDITQWAKCPNVSICRTPSIGAKFTNIGELSFLVQLVRGVRNDTGLDEG
ncbi:unnamed protein product [Gongylonema pulchrum]|uniref:J domain-containing protein n=1 Tax=Gongylonema pulchrum TaxID=637853 RepID=A0A183DTY0_9BILA|nr:unnamed protein product [Gongylonema pulchrum]